VRYAYPMSQAMHPDAEAIVRRLDLEPHPEGGFYRETFRSMLTVGGLKHAGGTRSASTAIYYLLPAGSFSALHRVASDEVWHFYDGEPLELHTIDSTGLHGIVRLGRDLAAGERPQHIVPAGAWQAAVPLGPRFTLCGCTVAPGFDFLDFELPPRDELMRMFPLLTSVIEQLTSDEPRDTIKIRLS